jgi:hypothetical protein
MPNFGMSRPSAAASSLRPPGLLQQILFSCPLGSGPNWVLNP